MSIASIYIYKDYRKITDDLLESERQERRGSQSRFSEYLGCQSAYVSMVLKGKAEFSIEQAALAADYFRFTDEEKHFFILLVQSSRTSDKKLKKYFDSQIEVILQNRSNLTNRLSYDKVLSQDHSSRYYSAWYYPSIHLALTIESLQNIDAVTRFFNLPKNVVQDVCDFLVQTGLAKIEEGKIRVGTTRIHTGKDSAFLNQSHVQWRLQAMNALQRPQEDDFHYSSIVSMAKEDLRKIRETMTNAIEEIRKTVRESPEETVVVYAMDLFRLDRK